jgi:hypothetical protein
MTSRHLVRWLAGLLFLVLPGQAAQGQSPSGAVIMKSKNSGLIQWWVVDPASGVAAFYGGDLLAICREEPDAHDLVDVMEVDIQDIRNNMVLSGKDVGASLWDHAPPFRVPGLCRDILARGSPMASGTANVRFTVADLEAMFDPTRENRHRASYGMTAQGLLTTPQGETLRVNAHYRCVAVADQPGARRCTQGVKVGS